MIKCANKEHTALDSVKIVDDMDKRKIVYGLMKPGRAIPLVLLVLFLFQLCDCTNKILCILRQVRSRMRNRKSVQRSKYCEASAGTDFMSMNSSSFAEAWEFIGNSWE